MSSFFRQTGYMGIGLVLSGVGGLVMNIGLGRVLPGPEYGVFRVFFSSVLLVGWVLAFGVEREVTAALSSTATEDSREFGVGITLLLSIAAFFIAATTLAQPYILDVIGDPALFVSFLGGCLAFLSYRFLMGVLKGMRRMELVGLQNVILGLVKIGIVGVVALLGWQSSEVGVSVVAMYLLVVALSIYWIRDALDGLTPGAPTIGTVRDVLFSTSKQVGDVTVKFGGPLFVGLLGGSDFAAGIFGGTLTLAFLPYYAYRAVINTILPEVSELHSRADAAGIGRRVGFLLEVTTVLIAGWTAFGYVLGPRLVRVVFKPTFEISALNAALVFFIASCVILSSLLTEVLIGVNAELDVAKSWLVPLAIIPAGALLPGPSIAATATAFSIYILFVTLLLFVYLHYRHVAVRYTGFDYRVFR